MPVKISSYMALRQDLEHIIGELYQDEEKEKLKRAVKEIDELYNNFEDATISDGGSLIKPEKGLLLGNIIEVKPKSRDNKRVGELLEEVHEVIRNHLVWPSVYNFLGGSFADVGIKPKLDTMIACMYGNAITFKLGGFSLMSDSSKIWWENDRGYAKQAYNNRGVVNPVSEKALKRIINEDLINKCDRIAWKLGRSTTDSDWYSDAQYKDDKLFIESHTDYIYVKYDDSRVFESRTYSYDNFIWKPKEIKVNNEKRYVYKFRQGEWLDKVNELYNSFTPKPIKIEWED